MTTATVRTRIDVVLAAEIYLQLSADLIWHAEGHPTFGDRLADLRRLMSEPVRWPVCGWGDTHCLEPAAFCDTIDGRFALGGCLGSQEMADAVLLCEVHETAEPCTGLLDDVDPCGGVAVAGWNIDCEPRYCEDGCAGDHGTQVWCAECIAKFDAGGNTMDPDFVLVPT